MYKEASPILRAIFLGVVWLGACTTGGKTAQPKPKIALNSLPCAAGTAGYLERLNGAFTSKALEINALAAHEADTSLAVAVVPRAPLDSMLINGANRTRRHALKQLCDKCSASALLQQDSLQFIEIYGRGYCYSYTLYVLNSKNQGIGYQRICAQPICRFLAKYPANSLLTIRKGKYFDGYGVLYVRSRYVNKTFTTEDISFLRTGAIEAELLK